MAVTRKTAAEVGTQSPTQPLRSKTFDPKNAPRNTLTTFGAEEVATHDTSEDLWVIVRSKVYDVTAWVPKHPGGDLITLRGGRDCTELFDSYHPLSARVVLDKFFIGEVAHEAGHTAPPEDELAEGTFYYTIKKRVHAYFQAQKVVPGSSGALQVKAVLILATLALSYHGAFFAFTATLPSLVSAALLGFAMAEVGVSIQHDANHGAFSRRSWVGALFGATLDAVGASSFMWRQQHMGGHHVHTNVHGLDPDIRVSEADVRRVTPHQPWHAYQAYQHLYLGLLYGLLSVKSVLVDDFQALASGSIGSLQLKRLSRREQAVFWGGKLFWSVAYVALPVAFSGHSWGLLLGVWALSQAITGWMLAFMFQVAHVVDDVEYLRPGSPALAKGWAAAQAAASADFSHGSFFWTHVSGGLNYQVVHHLFPAISHTHYPAIAPIVMQTCKEFGVPYKVYPTFVSALVAHFKHLKTMGLGNMSLVNFPSLATIG